MYINILTLNRLFNSVVVRIYNYNYSIIYLTLSTGTFQHFFVAVGGAAAACHPFSYFGRLIIIICLYLFHHHLKAIMQL